MRKCKTENIALRKYSGVSNNVRKAMRKVCYLTTTRFGDDRASWSAWVDGSFIEKWKLRSLYYTTEILSID